MTNFQIVSHREPGTAAVALPAVRPPAPGSESDQASGGVHVRPARQDDFAFVDRMQKVHKGCLGFQYESAIRTRIERGQLLVAEATRVEREKSKVESGASEAARGSAFDFGPSTFDSAAPQPVGYIMGQDRYFKRDEVGLIIQLAVAPGSERRLIGAHLLKAQFENSAYGCRLYCCWCAQDLKANKFWEAMGFVPLAFRTGGGRNRKDGPRLHIFWQKRIREGDTGDPTSGGTPYWFPSQTGAGAIAEDRLVLPIPAGTHWSDAKPIVLPEGPLEQQEQVKRLEDEVQQLERQRKAAAPRKTAEKAQGKLPGAGAVEAGGLHFGKPATVQAAERDAAATAAQQRVELDEAIKSKKREAKRAKKKFDPAQEAFARELKDRWLETVQARPAMLGDLEGRAKYDVRRLIEGHGHAAPVPVRSVDAVQVVETKRLAA